jgi:hypothetical protein
MSIDWDKIQKDLSPLRSYEDLCANLHTSFNYAFVRRIFNFTMAQLIDYTTRVLGEDTRQRYTAYLQTLTAAFTQLEQAGVKDVLQLIETVDTREKLAAFLVRSGVETSLVIGALKYLAYWFIPTPKYLRELSREDPAFLEAVARLRACGLRFNLDLLERGLTPAARRQLAETSGVAPELIDELVHRADFSRLPWASKATISNYVGAGYGSLARLAAAEPEQLSADFYRYGQSIGKNLKHGNEIDNGQRIARIVPRIVSEETAGVPVP